jgi:UDP-N-acetyl-D-mannosaminuronate dehydrogenase
MKLGLQACSLEEGFKDADCAIIVNNHKSYNEIDISQLLHSTNKPSVFIDGWRLFDPKIIEHLNGITYGGDQD